MELTLLEVRDLTVKYGQRTVLSDVTLEADHGVTALIGLNGEGKTTLLKAIAGLIPFSGHVNVSPRQTREQIDAVHFAPQFSPSVRSLRLGEVLAYLAILDGLPKGDAESAANNALERVGLSGEPASMRLSQLSGGMSKRFLIAQSLLTPAAVLLLDEPTSGLDPAQRRGVGELIVSLKESYAVVFSTHQMIEVVEWADRFVWLSNGQIRAQGETSSVTAKDLDGLLESAK